MTSADITDRPAGKGPGVRAAEARGQLETLIRAAAQPAARVRDWFGPLGAVTLSGWAVLAGSVVGWFAGRRLHWPELCLLSIVGLVVFGLCCAMALGRMSLRAAVQLSEQRIKIGQRAKVELIVQNTAVHRSVAPIPTEVVLPETGVEDRTFDLPALARGAVHAFEKFDVPGLRRGVVRIGPATSVRADPFGLVRRTMVLAGETELLVHPVHILLPPLGSGLLHDLEGRTTEHISSSDLEFHTLREYMPSDDARHIHWRSSAKISSARPGTSFLVRQFLETRLSHLLVLVDGDPGSYRHPAEFETAVSAGASIAVRALKDKLQLTFLVADRLAHEPTHPQALDACSRARLGPDSGLAALISRGLRVAPRATSVIIVTGPVPDYPKLRRQCLRIPRHLRTVAIRIDTSAPTGITAPGSLTLLSLSRLTELPVLIREGAAR
jgi:uncharacterized protein (DUF58 family)